MAVSVEHRFTRRNPCPICGGHADMPRGQGVRCTGYLTDDRGAAICTRHADGAVKTIETVAGPGYVHRLGNSVISTVRRVATRPPPTAQSLQEIADLARRWWEDLQYDDAALDFLWQRRAITPGTALDWGVGCKDIAYDTERHITTITWTFQVLSHVAPYPVTGVKCHRDIAPAEGAKSYWATSGVPAAQLLYPLPEAQGLKPGDQLVLAPGELKALAYLSYGIAATARTVGESAPWPEGMAERFRDLRVILDPDREDSDAARRFVLNAVEALRPIAMSVDVCV